MEIEPDYYDSTIGLGSSRVSGSGTAASSLAPEASAPPEVNPAGALERAIPKNPLAGYTPSWIEGFGPGGISPAMRVKQIQFDNDMQIFEAQRRVKQEERLYQALGDEEGQQKINNNNRTLQNMPLYRSILNSAKTPEERIKLAEQLAPLVPKGAGQAMILWMGKNKFATASGSAYLDALIRDGKLEQLASLEEYWALATNAQILKTGENRAHILASDIAQFATSQHGYEGDKAPIYAGMSEEEFIKTQKTGFNKRAMTKNPDTQQPMVDARDADLLLQYYDSPAGQAFMAGLGVKTSSAAYKQQLYNERTGAGAQAQTKSMSEALTLWSAEQYGGEFKTTSVDEFTRKAPRSVVKEFMDYYYSDIPQQRAGGKERGTFTEKMTQPVAPKELEDQFDRQEFLKTGRMIKPKPGTTGAQLRQTDIVNIGPKERETIAKQGSVHHQLTDMYDRAKKLFTASSDPLSVSKQFADINARSVYDTDIRTYYAMREGFTGLMARSLAYEVGTMTDGDISRARAFVPNSLDSAETVASKRKAFFDYMNFQQQAARRAIAGDRDVVISDKEFRETNERMLRQAEALGSPESQQKPPAITSSDALYERTLEKAKKRGK